MLRIFKSKKSLLIPTIISLPLIFSFAYFSPATASGVRKITVSEATGEAGTIPTIELWQGSGISLSFVERGEYIQKVWLDDPSRITVDFDSPLCSGDSRCDRDSGAQIVHLRRINPINFPQLPKTDRTLLTVITQRGARRNRYQFQLTYGSGTPRYVGITVVGDRTLVNSELATHSESDIIKGLQQAIKSGLISAEQGNADLEGRVKNFLNLIRDNVPAIEAAADAGVSLALIEKLASMGKSSIATTSDKSDFPFFPLPTEIKPFTPLEQ